MLQDVNNQALFRARVVERAMRRRDAIGLAILVALGLTLNDAGRRLVDAAKGQGRKRGERGRHSRWAVAAAVKSSGWLKNIRGQNIRGAEHHQNGFDCSGFTWYVYKKATGMDITRGVEEQWQFGRSVGRGEWQAGDMVFFENTFERGLSHVGIYISGDEFIHAENEQTGVVISSLNSEYYSKHYAGARRLL